MPNTFGNLSFETGDAIPGDAGSWDQEVKSSLIEIANFGFVAASPYETWSEGWGTENFILEFGQLDLILALWPSDQPSPFFAEGFEFEWNGNELWSPGLGFVDDAEFVGPILAEGFEAGWDNVPYDFELGAVEVGLFDMGANAFESFNFEFVPNGNPLWTGLEESYSTSVSAGVGASPSNYPVAVVFSNSPDILTLPAGFYDFDDIYVEVGDTINIRGSDVGDSNGTRGVTSVSGNVIGVDFPWDIEGTSTTPVHISTINNAAFVNHGGGGTPNFVAEPEFFDVSAWEVMDTL